MVDATTEAYTFLSVILAFGPALYIEIVYPILDLHNIDKANTIAIITIKWKAIEPIHIPIIKKPIVTNRNNMPRIILEKKNEVIYRFLSANSSKNEEIKEIKKQIEAAIANPDISVSLT